MIQKSFFCVVALILTALACQVIPTTPQSPDAASLETMTAGTLSAQSALLPSQPPIASITPTEDTRFPIVTVTPLQPPVLVPTSDVFFREEFDQGFSPGWSWLYEDPGRWSLTERPGFLRILLDPAGCQAAPANTPLRVEPAGDYMVETLVEFTPVSNFQLAGLIVYQDDENYLKLGRAFCQGGEGCIGNGIYFDSYFAGSFADTNFATSTFNPSRIYLRIQRSGDKFTAYFSEDGQNWGEIGQHSSALQPKGVGLFAGQSCSESIPADFDYFSISPLE